MKMVSKLALSTFVFSTGFMGILSSHTNAAEKILCEKAITPRFVLGRLSNSGIGRNAKENDIKYAAIRNQKSPARFLEVNSSSAVVTPETIQLAPTLSFKGYIGHLSNTIEVNNLRATVEQEAKSTRGRHEFTITGPRYKSGGTVATHQKLVITKNGQELLSEDLKTNYFNTIAISKNADFVTIASSYNTDSLIGDRGVVSVFKVETNNSSELVEQRQIGAGRLKNFFLNNSEFSSIAVDRLDFSPTNEAFIFSVQTLSKTSPEILVDRVLKPKEINTIQSSKIIEGNASRSKEDSWGREVQEYTFYYDIKTDSLILLWQGADYSSFSPNGRFVAQTQSQNGKLMVFDTALNTITELKIANKAFDDGSARIRAITDEGTVYYYNLN